MRCELCKHWRIERQLYSDGLRICRAISGAFQGDLAAINDCGSCESPLITRTDFGCVLFEKRAE